MAREDGGAITDGAVRTDDALAVLEKLGALASCAEGVFGANVWRIACSLEPLLAHAVSPRGFAHVFGGFSSTT